MKARIPNGGGAPNNMQGVIRQAQKMQNKMEEVQDTLNDTEYSSTSGGGMVEVVANGKHEIVSIKINPEAVDPNDVEILQDMILSAVNDVMNKIDVDNEEKMKGLTGGLKIPGLF